MCRARSLAAAAVLALSVAGAARAADMPGDLPLPLSSPPAKTQWATGGWYLRGDLGWRMGTIGSVDTSSPFPDPRNSKLGNGIVFGTGVGVKTRWLRTDLTVDYASSMKYTGSAATPGDTTARISSINALFNGYFDLGTWHRLTPYIGAGAGTALVRVTSFQSTGAPPFAGDTSHSQWNFAYAGMAGVGWTVAPNLLIDFGYRYLNVGNAHTGHDASGSTTFKNVGAHEVRVGLRWNFDDQAEFN